MQRMLQKPRQQKQAALASSNSATSNVYNRPLRKTLCIFSLFLVVRVFSLAKVGNSFNILCDRAGCCVGWGGVDNISSVIGCCVGWGGQH
jgi:hypothetical protein